MHLVSHPRPAPPRNEAQAQHDLIDPALEECGWTRGDIRVEETARAVDFDPVTKEARRRRRQGRTDYVLRRALAPPGTEPLPLVILEAKREGLPAEHGLAQAQGGRANAAHHMANRFSQERDSASQATNSVSQATNSASQATNSVLQATNSVSHVTNSVLQAGNGELQAGMSGLQSRNRRSQE